MASIVFLSIIMLSVAVALYSRRGHAHQDSRDFFVASGQFGGLLVFVLAVGETYSIGSILGFPAAAYGQGTSFVLWFLGYIVLAYPLGYFVNPLIWQAGRRCGALTIADLFRVHFASPALERIVVVNAILFLLPFGELQFAGLLNVLEEFHWNVPPLMLTGGAAIVTFAWLMLSGIRAPAYVSIIKDSLVVIAVILVGVAAVRTMGGLHAPPAGLPGHDRLGTQDQIYAMSTILLQAMGFCVAPQTVAFLFTARSGRTVRRNQIVMPLYMLMFPFLYLVAVYARVVGLPLPSANAVFMASAHALLPGWAVGIVAAACALSALVILAGTCLTLGPLVSHNLLHGLSDNQQRRGAQFVIALYLVFSIVAASHLSGLMVALTSMYYLGVSQMVPGMAAVIWRRTPAPAAIGAGLVVGGAVAVVLFLAGVRPGGLNAGLVGLLVNLATITVAQGLARMRTARA
ncbi:sodium:solute symporter [Gluconacetobacter azotocaptans]|uniref:Sodium:solute symporter n=1 Tax=Gluconacetobacter azotocaptans TaxID=142834 RepID=A0A7W4PF40_9PROT|nr:sodium:solute symporter [Gluconacetobacter azotocaptans]MBB2190169.1 sodium:solute symporter [Gluconacetobacter azotocaptans]GBQ28760.1 Na+/solute symporter [Gluconacetobacter azotocaptans DSM 13594]